MDRRRLERGFSRGEMLGEDKRTMRRFSSHRSLRYLATPRPPTIPSTRFVSVHSTLCNISRDISGKFSCAWNSKEKHSRPEEIVRRAREGYDSNEETFAHLYLDDLWAQAIASDHRLKERDCEVIEPLVELLN